MSVNCIQCVKNKRTGPDLLCDECRAESSLAAPAGWDAAHQLDIYLEAWRNIETAQGHARIGHFDSAAFNCRMAAEKLQALHDSKEHPNNSSAQTR